MKDSQQQNHIQTTYNIPMKNPKSAKYTNKTLPNPHPTANPTKATRMPTHQPRYNYDPKAPTN